MNIISTSNFAQRLVRADLAICMLLNRTSDLLGVRVFFTYISRLGDGVFWYTLTLIIPFIYGMQGVITSIRMAVAGLVTVISYKLIKYAINRPRPYTVNDQIRKQTVALDQYSFPSGHTMHAVAFSAVAIHYHSELGWLLLPFTSLIALSRMILGLHYPTDVVIGAFIGAGLAYAVLLF